MEQDREGSGEGRAARRALFFCLTAAALAVAAPPVGAAAKKSSRPPAKSVSAQVAEQRAQIRELTVLVQAQQAMIDSQRTRLAAQEDSSQAKLAMLEAQLAVTTRRLAELESQAGVADWGKDFEERLKRIEADGRKTPELPPDVVSAGDFPGSIRIPGSDAAVKFGGRIRTALVLTLDPLGTDDRFLTNSIPVGAEATSGEAKRTNISARASRLNVEFRTPSGRTEVRAFFEGDFNGTGNAFRLRHAYAQASGFILGQTWSTFSDPETDLQDLDDEGVSSENITRQPLIRYWWRPAEDMRAAVAIETPSASITGGEGVNVVPDLVGRIYAGRRLGGHLQFASVLRQVRGEAVPGDVRSDIGWGLSLSGVAAFRVGSLTDRVVFQINGGEGIARYINDLDSQGGQDAVFDTSTGELYSLPALAWYVAYKHMWKEWTTPRDMNLRSTLIWSRVGVDNFDFQPPDAYRRTNRVAANVIVSPSQRVDLGLEYIWGERTNHDGQSGHANQVQAVALIRF
jgi:hypothetical protein